MTEQITRDKKRKQGRQLVAWEKTVKYLWGLEQSWGVRPKGHFNTFI